jgi:hypothetical protein
MLVIVEEFAPVDVMPFVIFAVRVYAPVHEIGVVRGAFSLFNDRSAFFALAIFPSWFGGFAHLTTSLTNLHKPNSSKKMQPGG